MGRRSEQWFHKGLFKILYMQNKKLLYLFTLAMVVLLPAWFMLATLAQKGVVNPAIRGSDAFQIGFTLINLLVIQLSIFAPLYYFSFLNTKNNLDTMFAIPIKRKALFRTTVLFTLATVVVPYLGVSLISVFLGQLMGIFSQLSLSRILSMVLLISVSVPGIMVLALFARVNTGTGLDSLIQTCLLHLLPWLTVSVFTAFGYLWLQGFAGISTTITELLSPLSVPMENLFSYMIYTEESLFTFPRLYGLGFWLLLFILMWVFGASLMDRFRAEKSQKPFVNRFFSPLTSSLATIDLYALLLIAFSQMFDSSPLNLSAIILSALFTLVGYLIFSVITRRSFARLGSLSLRAILLIVLSFALLATAFVTDGFGYEQRVPSVASVTQLSITNNGYTYYDGDLLSQVFPGKDYGNDNTPFLFRDKDNIAYFVAAHQQIVDRLTDEEVRYDENTNWRYRLQGGRSMRRQYNLADEQLLQMLPVLRSQEYLTQLLRFKSDETQSIILMHRDGIQRAQVNTELLRQALLEDISGMTEDAYFNPDGEIEQLLYLNLSSSTLVKSVINELNDIQCIALTKSYSKTLALLAQASMLSEYSLNNTANVYYQTDRIDGASGASGLRNSLPIQTAIWASYISQSTQTTRYASTYDLSQADWSTLWPYLIPATLSSEDHDTLVIGNMRFFLKAEAKPLLDQLILSPGVTNEQSLYYE